ncbi:hypothetical protein FA13DRAFT_1738363 [Coprinellus micaceus]|uniref:Uncharacterized protein n=1 Tax=Coprinellus micaceus TaxID=71717 RepID=A0A4Y7SU80_COPMI|nr:hypothetical protein FA13DRAFT_1738363 [Coprinellus micaceus]
MPRRPLPHSAEDEPINRPRLKDVKTEALLRSVERGSVTHIARMSAFERYPGDSHDGAIVLRSVLRLLDAELSPTRPSPLGSTPGPQLQETLQRILGWMDIVCISIRKINEKDTAMLATFTGIYKENLHVVLRWLRFYMGEARWAFTWQFPAADMVAPKVVIETLHNMHTVCKSDDFRATMHTSGDVIDLLLSVWLWQDRHENAMYLTYPPEKSGGKYALDPTIHLFAEFCLDRKSQFLVWEKVFALTGREQIGSIKPPPTLSRTCEGLIAR